MRRWIVSLVGVGMVVACTSQALAGGGWGYPGCPPHHGGHHSHWRGYPGPRGGYGYGYGGYGPRAVGVPYGYGVGYGYGYGGYPSAGFGVATRNFSLWLQQ